VWRFIAYLGVRWAATSIAQRQPVQTRKPRFGRKFVLVLLIGLAIFCAFSLPLL